MIINVDFEKSGCSVFTGANPRVSYRD